MSKKNKKEQVAGAAVLVNANVADFRRGTRNRADRLVDAVRPITDAWYPVLRRSAAKGAADLFIDWERFYGAMFKNSPCPFAAIKDRFFRLAAMKLVLNSLENESYGVDGRKGFPEEVVDLIKHLQHYVWLMFEVNFGARAGVKADRVAVEVWLRLVCDIDTLHLEYEGVA